MVSDVRTNERTLTIADKPRDAACELQSPRTGEHPGPRTPIEGAHRQTHSPFRTSEDEGVEAAKESQAPTARTCQATGPRTLDTVLVCVIDMVSTSRGLVGAKIAGGQKRSPRQVFKSFIHHVETFVRELEGYPHIASF